MYTAISPVVTNQPQVNLNEMNTSLAWARDQFDDVKKTNDKFVDQLGGASARLDDWGKSDRKFWEDTYKPVQERFVSDAQNWDSADRRAEARGAATSRVSQAVDAADAAASRQLEGYGVDPTATRYAALNRQSKLARAAAGSAAADVADRSLVQQAAGMRAAASQLGQGVAGQALQETNAGTATAATAGNLKNATAGTFMNALGNPQGWSSLVNGANGALSGAQNVANQGQQAQWQQQQESGGGLGSILGLAGGIAGSFLGPAGSAIGSSIGGAIGNQIKFEDGGPVPDFDNDEGGGYVDPAMSPSGGATTDDIEVEAPGGSARINAGEFVMPRRATEYYGTKFFTDLIAKADKALGIEPQPVGPEMAPAAPPMPGGLVTRKVTPNVPTRATERYAA